MDTLIERARSSAIGAHARINQLRKYTRQPYDVHLKAVADLVASAGGDEAMIAAAWLHDTVEDTPATFEDIEREFGADVMHLVKELTDVSQPGDGNRAVRKAIDLRHAAAASPRAKTVKLADLIDNCADICGNDKKFARVYIGEARALLEVLAEGDGSLHAQAVRVVTSCEAALGLGPDVWQAPEQRPPEMRGDKHGKPGPRGIRLFMEAFTARDIQEPLHSFDTGTVGHLPPGEWPAPGRTVAGVRENGVTTGYLLHGDLDAGQPLRVRQIDGRQIVDLEAPLTDVIFVLTNFTCCFVALDGAVVGVVRRADIEKPAVRMWLFGIIILIEVQVVELIRRRWPDGGWTACVSEGRLEKARQLQAERLRRGLPADLLDCLQFSDKLQLALQLEGVVEAYGFGSASAAKKVLKDIEALRNNLAHGQDVTSRDWPQIVRLARRVRHAYGAP